MTSSDEASLDCEELQRLCTLTTRASVKALLTKQIEDINRKVQSQGTDSTSKPKEKEDAGETPAVETAVPPPKTAVADAIPRPTETQKVIVSKVPTKTITSYGWDQSPKFVKVYVTMNGVHSLAKENVSVEFTSSSFTLRVKKKDCIHQLVINSLLQQVLPEKSHHKVKTDSVVVLLKKTSESKWDYLTRTEEKAKQKSKPAAPKTDTADPSAGIMGLMKQMYDDGDDEMKRSIAKAWTQAQDKKGTMELP